MGKRIAYVYRGKREIRGTKIRVIWGKVRRTHGMYNRGGTAKQPGGGPAAG